MIIKPTKQLKQSNNLTSAPSFQVSISHLSELQGRNVCLWWPFDLSPKQRHTLLKKTQGLPITPSHLQMLAAIVHQDMPLLAKSKVLDGFQSKLGCPEWPKIQNYQNQKGFCALHFAASPSSSWRGTLKPINLQLICIHTVPISEGERKVNILGYPKVSRCQNFPSIKGDRHKIPPKVTQLYPDLLQLEEQLVS